MDDITTKHDHPDPIEPESNPHVAYEHGDADIFTVTKYTIALVFGILIAATAMWGLFDYFNSRVNLDEAKVPKVIVEQQPLRPPEPTLQRFPKQYVKDLRAAEQAQLNSYGWVDQKEGRVRIPIDQAIDAVSKAGLASRPVKGDEGLDQDGIRELPSAGSSGRTMEKIP
jgi:hypothetical protein